MNYQVNQQEIASVVIKGTDVKTTATDIIKIPANTVVTGIVYEEVEKCDASKAITLKAKTAHADSGSFNGFTTGSGTTCANGYNPAVSTEYTVRDSAGTGTTSVSVPGVFYTKNGDVLTISQASAALTQGKLRIGVVGFRTGMTENRLEETNKAPADPYTPPEKA